MTDYIELYFRNSSIEIIKQILGTDITPVPYKNDVLLTRIKPGNLSKFDKFQPTMISSITRNTIIVGEFTYWRQLLDEETKETAGLIPNIRIRNHPVFSEGIVITPYSEIDVKYHLKKQTISERTGIHREEFLRYTHGSMTDPVVDGFDTYDYYDGWISVNYGFIPPLVIYKKPKTLREEQLS